MVGGNSSTGRLEIASARTVLVPGLTAGHVFFDLETVFAGLVLSGSCACPVYGFYRVRHAERTLTEGADLQKHRGQLVTLDRS